MEPPQRRYGSPEEVLRSLDEAAEAAHERAARTESWKDDVMAVRGRGTAMGTGVVVEVDSGGALLTLGIRDDAARQGGPAVAHAVLEAQSAAHAQVRERVAAMTTATFGAETPTTRAVTAEVDRAHRSDGLGSPDGPRAGGGTW
jgi:hypothetical protein